MMNPDERSKPAATDPAYPDGRAALEQPRWRRDFPIDWAEDDYVSRRELTKFIVLTSAAFTVGQMWIVWENWRRSRRG